MKFTIQLIAIYNWEGPKSHGSTRKWAKSFSSDLTEEIFEIGKWSSKQKKGQEMLHDWTIFSLISAKY